MSSFPKVSVCIPTFNGAPYIRDAIDSVLNQTLQNFEIIVVNNCSTDHTETIVKEYLLLSNQIFYYKNTNNIGMAENFNKCLEYAKGAHIKFLCDDDILMPDCLKTMSSELDAHPNVSLVCAGRLLINESAGPIGLRRYSHTNKIFEGGKVISECLMRGNLIGEPSAIMFRKPDPIMRFRDELPQLMDMEMWFRLIENNRLLNINIPLCSIRIHAGQMTSENMKSSKIVYDNIILFEEFKNKPYLKVSLWLLIWQKLLMTYRVWACREFMLMDKRGEILRDYGVYFLYPFMPILSTMINSHYIKKLFSR